LLLFFCLFLHSVTFSQTITFCNKLNAEEQCDKSIKKYYFSSDKGAPIFAVVRLPSEIGTTQVLYKLYRFGEDDEEIYMTTLTQNVIPEWKTFYKQIVFTRESGYKVYLYTDKGQLITSAEISILEDFGAE
ncbi:MAG: hypothetical protein AB7G44_17260, partial [Bacteroidia bacterium]